MEFSVTTVIVLVTVLVSIVAFGNREWFYKLSYNPHSVREKNEWYRAITHAFIHADYIHLFFNMYVLYNFGKVLEVLFIEHFQAQGIYFFLLLYFGAAMFATLISYMRHKYNVMYNSVGASGAVAAIIFSFIVMMPDRSLVFIFLPVPIPAFVFGALYLVAEYFLDKRGRDNVAHDAHFLGALFGILFTVALDYNLLFRFWDRVISYF